MRRTRAKLVGVVMLAGVGWVSPAVAQFTEYAESSAVVRIRHDVIPQLNEGLVNALIHSEAIFHEALRELDIGRAQAAERDITPIFEVLSADDRRVPREMIASLFISEHHSGPEPLGPKIVRAVARRLNDSLEAIAERDRAEWTARRVELQRRLAELRVELGAAYQARAEIVSRTSIESLDRNVLSSRRHLLQQELEGLELNLAAMAARERELVRQLESAAADAERAWQDDMIAAELAEVVAIREQQVEQARKLMAAQLESERSLLEVLEPAAQARAQLMQRREQAVGHVRSLMNAMNDDLRRVAVERAELEARRAAMRDQLNLFESQRLFELADELARDVMPVLQAAEGERQQLESQLYDLELRLRSFRLPQVTIIGEELDKNSRP